MRRAFVALLFAASAASAQEKVELNTISSVVVRGNTIEVVGSKRPNFTTFTMTDPPRLVIDISEAVFKGVPDTLPGSGHITGIKTASYGSDASAIARVLVGFDKEIETDIQTEGDTKLVVKLLNVGAAEPPPNVAETPPDAGTGEKVAGLDSTAAAKQAEAERAAQEKAAKEAAEAARREAEAAAKAQKEAMAQAEADKKKADAEAKAAAERAEKERVAQEKAAKLAEAQAKKEAEAQAKAQKEAEEKARRDAEAEARRQKAEEEKARKEAERLAREEERRASEEEKKRKADEAKALAQAKKDEEAAARAAAEEEKRLKADQAKAEAEAKRQAALDARKAAADEARAKAEAEKLAREEAKKAAEEEKRRKIEEAQAAADARRQAAEDEKRRKAEEAAAAKQAAEDRRAAEAQAAADKKRQAEEAKNQKLAMAEKPSFTESVNVSPRKKTMSFVGFSQQSATSRIYVRTNEPVRYAIGEAGKNVVVLTLENTSINLSNNQRQLDTTYFDTAVAGVKAAPGGGSTVRIEITLKDSVPYSAKQQGNEVWVEFARPPRK